MNDISQQNIHFNVGADGIAILTIDVVGRPMNVLTPAFTAELDAAVQRIASSADIKGAVITSGKANGFIAGADIKDMVTAYDRGITPQQGAEFSSGLTRVLRRLETCGKPVAAAINGVALGGGFEVCLACHYRVLADDDPKAAVGLPEVTIGLLPGAGGTQRVPRLIGVEKALPILLQGQPVKPADALKLGLVHATGPKERLVEMARAWIASGPEATQPWDRKGFKVPGGSNPAQPNIMQAFMVGTALVAKQTHLNFPAPAEILSAVYEGVQVPIDLGLKLESKHFGKLLAGPVARNLMRTMFVNKGLADKLDRRPAGVPKSQVKKLGILGAGMMGAGIAYVSAQAGIEVVLLDSTLELAEKGKSYSQKLLQKDLERRRTTPEKMQALLARIHTTTDYAQLEGCDLIVEAVFENRDIKADVTAKTEAVIPKNAVFASNTSSLPITELATASKRPKQFIGIHFFSPVDKMALVEIIVGKKTDEETLARALDFVGQLRKTPIVVNDSRGFYTSRVFGTFTYEGQRMLEDGIEPALIENAGRMAGMPVGPLAVTDEVSIELQYHVLKQAQAALGDKWTPPPSWGVVLKMVEELKRGGRKYGKGFYDYPADGGKKVLWPGLKEIWPPAAVQPDVEEVKKRLLYIQALDTARCFEEGVVTTAAEADLGSILGWGFPAYTGGTLSFIDTVGIREFVAECQKLAKKYGPRFKPSRWLMQRAAEGKRFHPLPGESSNAA